jgi:hypothetical protein
MLAASLRLLLDSEGMLPFGSWRHNRALKLPCREVILLASNGDDRMRTLIALAALCIPVLCSPLDSAKAEWNDHRFHHRHHGGGLGVFVGPPPVYYAPPPVYYAPPVRQYAASCYAGPVSCPLYSPRPYGAPCQCRYGYGAYPGRAG